MVGLSGGVWYKIIIVGGNNHLKTLAVDRASTKT